VFTAYLYALRLAYKHASGPTADMGEEFLKIMTINYSHNLHFKIIKAAFFMQNQTSVVIELLLYLVA